MEITSEIVFADWKLKKSFLGLDATEKQLKQSLESAFEKLEKNAFVGKQIPKKLFPKEYSKYGRLYNLWKYDLPNGWRLIYTVRRNEVVVLSVVLEWMSHKKYERRFKY